MDQVTFPGYSVLKEVKYGQWVQHNPSRHLPLCHFLALEMIFSLTAYRIPTKLDAGKKNSHHAACVLFEREDFQRAFATSAIRKMNTDKAVDVGNFQQQGRLLQSGGKSR